MRIEHNVFVENINDKYVYEPNVGDIVFLDGIWLDQSVVDKIQKLNNGHTLIHLEALTPGAYSGWFNKDKVLIYVYQKITFNEFHEYYDKLVSINRQPTQIPISEQDIGILNDHMDRVPKK